MQVPRLLVKEFMDAAASKTAKANKITSGVQGVVALLMIFTERV
jgi:hypothetical protein